MHLFGPWTIQQLGKTTAFHLFLNHHALAILAFHANEVFSGYPFTHVTDRSAIGTHQTSRRPIDHQDASSLFKNYT